MRSLYKEDGTLLTTYGEIEDEILGLYGNLMGKENNNLDDIDIVAMREGSQLSNEQMWLLEVPVIEVEIEKALKDIGDLKAPGVYGFGEFFLNPLGE